MRAQALGLIVAVVVVAGSPPALAKPAYYAPYYRRHYFGPYWGWRHHW